jgi:ABC-type transporter Mla MlaB component
MLRISIMDSSDRLRIFRLEGMVIGRWVEELRDLCEQALGQSQEVMVDLNDVSYIDREGIALLMSLRDRQVALLNPQPFVAELLKRPTN